MSESNERELKWADRKSWWAFGGLTNGQTFVAFLLMFAVGMILNHLIIFLIPHVNAALLLIIDLPVQFMVLLKYKDYCGKRIKA